MNLTQEYQLIVLQPEGRLDLKHGNTLKEQLSALVSQPNHLLVIDLAQVDFMDSSGLAALVAGRGATRSSGSRLVICNPQPSVRMIFELTGLDCVFEIFPNYDAVLTTINTKS